MSSEREDREFARILQSALRLDTPPGLTVSQRAAIEQAAQAFQKRPSHSLRWLLVACALLLVLPAAAYYGVVRPREQRLEAERMAAERLAIERQTEAKFVQEENERKLKRAQEQAKEAAAMAAAQAAEAERRLDAAESPPLGPARCDRASCRSGRATSKAAGGKSRASSAACDPNDPLCGL